MHTSKNLYLNFSTNLIENFICKMSENDHQRRTKLNLNASHFVPRQQQHDPVPLQILVGSPQQVNPFRMEQSNNPMQLPQQNVGPQKAPQNQFSKLAQINCGLVIPGEMF